jgi:1,4-alpha-glucan branching enzyme
MKTNQKWKESINEKFFFMNATHDKSSNGIYSVKNSIKPINFYCPAHGAKTVHLAGDFNHWHPILMEQRDDGWWFVQVWLPHGHHEYWFLVDGKRMLDQHATGTARDEHYEEVSLIAVS